ncbi:MAG: helix-turn-helix domain-containing protein [Endomicrobiia bacterium]|nr:helix-turn-helix domain-containing protein [Endomicrobiia bacterium]
MENTQTAWHPKDIKEIMDIKELSEYLGIGKSKIYALIRAKKIPASKIGRQYRFSKGVVDNWLKEKIITRKEDADISLFVARQAAEIAEKK